LPDLGNRETHLNKPVSESKLAERRKTIEEVETIQNDIDEMTRKANAAIR